jgi:hypothetical protein
MRLAFPIAKTEEQAFIQLGGRESNPTNTPRGACFHYTIAQSACCSDVGAMSNLEGRKLAGAFQC